MDNQTKDRPILMSAPMVRAILAGDKTQTRRIVKPQPIEDSKWVGGFKIETKKRTEAVKSPLVSSLCPYGQPGDQLWVREAFDFVPFGGPDQPQSCAIVYWATGSYVTHIAPCDFNPMIYGHAKVRPSIHMPRWASRITLVITSVRVERLQDINEADSVAEGIEHIGDCNWRDYLDHPYNDFTSARRSYRSLWEKINRPGSWDANPWVWMVEFKRVLTSSNAVDDGVPF